MHTLSHRLSGTVVVPALACALALLAVVLYVAAAQGHHHDHGPVAGHDVADATWVERPASVDAATKDALFVVEARVAAVRTGTAITSAEDIGGGATETDTTPTQLIDFTTRSVIKGSAPSSFTLNKTGSSSWYIEGDPPYAVGQRYLLFVERFVDENGTVAGYIPLGPDSRLEIDANDLLHAFIDGPMAVELDGKPLEAAKGSVRTAMFKAGLVPTTTTTATAPIDVVAGPGDTVEDVLGDLDDQVSAGGTGAVETVEGTAPPVAPPAPVAGAECPTLPIYCPAP